MSWDPSLYLAFSDARLRPALDLIARIPATSPARIADLGCGPGNVTAQLAKRWPEAEIVGVDSSAEMLARARDAQPTLRWELGNAAQWYPPAALDLLFSNAALHWLGDHGQLFPRLAGLLAEGGWLAVQMPANFGAPSHALIRQLAGQARWRARLADARMGAVLAAEQYFSLLRPYLSRLDIWETTYWQWLEGEAPILSWLSGTTLRPYLACLSPAEQTEFLAELSFDLERAYPAGQGGVLFPFKRLFIVGQRGPFVSRET